jgi:hypothetical protein
MFISVQFKNKNNEFVGKTYDYELIDSSVVPKLGDVIRMIDGSGNPVCYGTRVKVVAIKTSSLKSYEKINYLLSEI